MWTKSRTKSNQYFFKVSWVRLKSYMIFLFYYKIHLSCFHIKSVFNPQTFGWNWVPREIPSRLFYNLKNSQVHCPLPRAYHSPLSPLEKSRLSPRADMQDQKKDFWVAGHKQKKCCRTWVWGWLGSSPSKLFSEENYSQPNARTSKRKLTQAADPVIVCLCVYGYMYMCTYRACQKQVYIRKRKTLYK